MRTFIATALAGWLALTTAAMADQRDVRLGPLFERLANPTDMADSLSAEAMIWQIWTEAGREDVDDLMQRGIEEMNARALDLAIRTFDRVVELAPDFAEGWNKRATAYYLDDQLEESVEDIQRTLALEPRHFGALSGMGLIFIQQRDFAGAAKAYREVLKIHPNARGVRERVKLLERLAREQVI